MWIVFITPLLLHFHVALSIHTKQTTHVKASVETSFFSRLIVGNTYQYLTPLPGEEALDTFRYKWQVYVRVPPGDPDTATFLQSVTFVLDQSYSPHHVITLKLVFILCCVVLNSNFLYMFDGCQ